MNVHVGTDDVPEDIPLDKVAVDAVFRRSLKVHGWKAYLRKLEQLTDFHGDERQAAVTFQALGKDLAQQTDYRYVQLDDFSRYGLKERHIEKIRFAVIQLDNESPKVGGGRHGTATTGTPEDYEDDFEVDDDEEEEDDDDEVLSAGSHRGSEEFYRGSGKGGLLHQKQRDTVDELEEEVEEVEEDERAGRRRDSGGGGGGGGTVHQHPRSVTAVPATATSALLAPHQGIMSPVYPAAAQSASASASAVSDDATASARMRGSTASVSLSDKRRKKNSSWIREGRWKRGEAIGKGSFGEVFKAMNDKGKLFAVKQLNMAGKQNEVEDLIREIETMKELEHPNIVAYVGACVDEEKGFVYIFQEWAPGGSVAHLLKNFGPFDLGTIRSYTRQILHGLVYLHENGIVHRDIKGGNVLVDTGTVKLADFGASTKLDFGMTQNTSTVKGTPYFMAPETLSESKYGRKGDIWAVGCTIIQMLTGDPPWKDRNLQNLVQLHMHLLQWTGPPTFAREVPPEVHACLAICFSKDPDTRPSAAALLQCAYLHHVKNVDDLDESTNSLPDHTVGGIGAFGGAPYGRPGSGGTTRNSDGDDLEDSAVMLKQQISRAVSRASLSVQERAGGVTSLAAAKPMGLPSASNPFAKGQAHQGGGSNSHVEHGGLASDSSEANDSTMGGIERQILQRQREKQRQQQAGGPVGLFTGKPVPARCGAGDIESPPTDAIFYPRKTNDPQLTGRDGAVALNPQGAPSSSNPFAKGVTSLTHKVESPALARGRGSATDSSVARSTSYSPSSQSHSRPQSLSPAIIRGGGGCDEPDLVRHGDAHTASGAPRGGIACRDAAQHGYDECCDENDANDQDDEYDDNRVYRRSRLRDPNLEPMAGNTPPRHPQYPGYRQRSYDTQDDPQRREPQYRRATDDVDSTLVYNHDADDINRNHVRHRDHAQARRESKPGSSDSDWDEKDSDRRRDRSPRWSGHGDNRQGDFRRSDADGSHTVGRLVTRATLEERGIVPPGDQQRLGPALKKKVASVRNSIGGADVGSGLDGLRGRSHTDSHRGADDDYRGRQHGHGHGRPRGDYDEGEEPELDVIADIRRTGPDTARRAATSSAAVRSQVSLAPINAEKRVHTAGAAVQGARNWGATPSVGRSMSPAAAFGRYAPPKTATTARFDSDDDTADEGSGDDTDLHFKQQRQQEYRVKWYCANAACKRANNNPDYYDACEHCATPRSGPFSLVGRRAF